MWAVSDTATAQQQIVQRRIHELGPWFHNLTLEGVPTAPNHFLGDFPSNFFQHFADLFPADLSGWSVLDIGCNAGFYSFEMKRRGAAEVVGIDFDEDYLAQARYAASVLGHDVRFERMSVYDVPSLGRQFDLVIFMGVFYHLRHPLLALDLLRRCTVGRLMVFQTLQRGSRAVMPLRKDYEFADESPFARDEFPRMHFIEERYAHDQTNWWIPNRACSEAMLRSSGFEILARPIDEVYLCRPQPEAQVDLPGIYEEAVWSKR